VTRGSQVDVPKAAAAAAAAGAAVATGAAVKHGRRRREPRSYRVRKSKALPKELARIARGRIDHALDELRGKTKSSSEEAVHEARKDMKKLRALLRLARDELGDEVYRRENDCFRDAAGRLSGVRDADVMLGTLDGLDTEVPELRKALEAHREVLAAGGEQRDEVVAVLEDARERVDDWPLEDNGFEAIEPGLTRIYRRGRRALQEVEHEPTTEALHEWRKRVKDHRYHVDLLEKAWPATLGAVEEELHALSDRLGEDHDLAVLQDWAHEHVPGVDLDDLDEEIGRRRAKLQADGVAIGRRLYAERPRAFGRRFQGLWEAWRAPAAHRVRVP
jgi:CHAD domain-containing protein